MPNFITKNFSKPQGVFGVLLLNFMNRMHKKSEAWALSKIQIKEDMCILDVGCGGGANVYKIADRLKDGCIFGVDYSKDCVLCSKKLNQKAINKGKVRIIEACASNLPFEDEKFDIITAFETIYFWPDLKKDFKEIRRVLKTGGIFCILTKASLKRSGCKWEKAMLNKHVYLFDEVLDMLREAKFSSYEHILHENGKWNLYIGVK
ncbi:class I SAM-dependent methyltransferase [Campylobacter sp. CCUG 57310]|uniref:class I SAM-dependent methyltransferase n=1 Tax=Campylobacter sp. CCUG 57310 TaxID=2517362 RepID=UPI001565B320|nr:class I SAM-dependent methyltransferase [Campylobacter sp. CCUG 57310]QKF91314.1 SAM-dependent methyltransferase [Campylobacter sp. CCUG 57310]